MRSLSLRTKIITGFVVPIMMFILVAILGATTSNLLRSNYNIIADVELPLILALEETKFSGTRLISSTNEFLLDALLTDGELESGEATQIIEAREQYEASLNLYHHLLLSHNPASSNDLFPVVEEAGQSLLEQSNQIIEAIASKATIEDILNAREQFEETEIEFLQTIAAAVAAEQTTLGQSRHDIATFVMIADVAISLISILALATSIGLAIYLIRTIGLRLKHLTATAEGLRAGKMNLRTEIDSTDELGQFAQTFNSMAERVETLVGDLEQQVVSAQTAREQAERSDNVKSAFLASMSHELRTPLNAVINFTKFVAQGDLGPVNTDQKEMLFESIDSARHLLNLINDVLDMSKIESGSLNLFVQDNVSVKEILDSVISTGQSLVAHKPVQLRTVVDGELPCVRGDKQRIRQIMLNIVSNACKFTEKGYIEVRAASQNGELLIAVEDTGPGIAIEDQASVFEPFKQTTRGLRQGGGTGLGMPISKNLAEIHGGRLWLESEPDKGSTFFVTLPIKSEALIPLNLN